MAQTRATPARRTPRPPQRKNKRRLMTIDIRDIEDVRELIKSAATDRQYTHVEPFLRRLLVLLFRDGQLARIKF